MLSISIMFYGCSTSDKGSFDTVESIDVASANVEKSVSDNSIYNAAIKLAEFSTHQNDLAKLNLKGNVKSTRVTKTITNGEIDNSWGNKEVLFNEQGNIISERRHLLDGTMKIDYSFIMNDRGYKIEMLDGDEISHRLKWTYDYDDFGNEIERKFFSVQKDELRRHWIFRYDSLGNQIEEVRYGSNGSFEFKRISEYSNMGNWIKRTMFDSNDQIFSLETYEYNGYHVRQHGVNETEHLDFVFDSKGNLIEQKWYEASGGLKVHYKNEFVYDEKGNWIQQKKYNDEPPHKIEIPYKIYEREIYYY